MPLIILVILVVLHLLTILWYFLVRKDVLSYLNTQIKLLGRESEPLLSNTRLWGLLYLYAMVLIVLMIMFTFYLASL